MSVDFNQVRQNAAKEGIDIQQIAIKYEGLTPAEMSQLEAQGLMKYRLSDSSALGTFPPSGNALFQDKAIAVHYLAA